MRIWNGTAEIIWESVQAAVTVRLQARVLVTLYSELSGLSYGWLAY